MRLLLTLPWLAARGLAAGRLPRVLGGSRAERKLSKGSACIPKRESSRASAIRKEHLRNGGHARACFADLQATPAGSLKTKCCQSRYRPTYFVPGHVELVRVVSS